jgi:hypothetical protein
MYVQFCNSHWAHLCHYWVLKINFEAPLRYLSSDTLDRLNFDLLACKPSLPHAKCVPVAHVCKLLLQTGLNTVHKANSDPLEYLFASQHSHQIQEEIFLFPCILIHTVSEI